MAIDDNTSYELTGAQVKDLANKIKAKAADNVFVGATSAIPGSKGIVPAPQAGDDTKFLSGDGTWKTVSSGGGSYTAGNGIDITNDEISIDTTVVAEVSDLPTDFTGATSSTAGANGLVPAPTTSDPDKFLKGDGTWGEATSLTNFYLANPLRTYTRGDTLSLYTDASLTTAITQQDFADAVEQGGVRLINSDSTRHWLNIYELSFVEDDGSHSITNPDAREYEFLDLSDGFSYHSMTSDGPVASTNFIYNGMTKPQDLIAGSNIQISNANVISATDTTYSTGNATTAGITKLYTTTGQNIDGAVTQKLFTDTVGDVETILQTLISGNGAA